MDSLIVDFSWRLFTALFSCSFKVPLLSSKRFVSRSCTHSGTNVANLWSNSINCVSIWRLSVIPVQVFIFNRIRNSTRLRSTFTIELIPPPIPLPPPPKFFPPVLSFKLLLSLTTDFQVIFASIIKPITVNRPLIPRRCENDLNELANSNKALLSICCVDAPALDNCVDLEFTGLMSDRARTLSSRFILVMSTLFFFASLDDALPLLWLFVVW